MVLFLAVVKTVTEPDTPDDIEVCTESGHDMPVRELLAKFLIPAC
jgi:hypothetical protein